MKSLILIFVLLFTFVCNHIFAQQTSKTEHKIPAKVIQNYLRIIRLIKTDKVGELSKLIDYPLKRKNPLPDIYTPKQFIESYNLLFDSAFKNKLRNYNDSIVFENNFAYGLVGGKFNGDIWIDENGKINTLNYSSKQESILQKQLTKKIQNRMYASVNSWKYNILVAKSANLLIRVDYTGKGLRYVSWSKGKSISQKPDLVLYKGINEPQGTMGGWTYTFKNGDWTYVVDDVEMCENDKPNDCGLFLRLLFKDKEKSSTRLTESK